MTDSNIPGLLEMLQGGRHSEAKGLLEQFVAAEPWNALAQHLLGVARYGLGDSAGAIAAYQCAIGLGIDDAAAYNNLGAALNEQERYPDAISAFQTAIAKKSDYAEPYFNLAATFQRLGRHLEAIVTYQKFIALDPFRRDAYFCLGASLSDVGRHEDALSSYRKAIAIDSAFVQAYCGLADSLCTLNRYTNAVEAYEQAITLGAGFVAYNNLAATLKALGQHEKAAECYRNAIAANRDNAEAYVNLAKTLILLGRHVEAVANLEQAIHLNPGFDDAFCTLGAALCGLKKNIQAVAACQNAIALTRRTNFAEPYFHLGTAFCALQQHGESIAAYQMAVALQPDYAEANSKLGGVLFQLGRHEEAIEAYESAICSDPDLPFAHGMILHCKMLLHDWDGIDKEIQALLHRVDEGKAASSPFILFSVPSSPEQQKRCAEIYARSKYPAAAEKPQFEGTHDHHEKVRIGYFSADFYDHPVARLTAELFERHDRSRFEIYAFAYGSAPLDDMRTRLTAAFDHFFDVQENTDEEIAALARANEIDLAVDLTGFTGNVRTGIFALRAAPLQASYLGYLGTMGAPYIDYLIADAMVIPAVDQSYYTEEIVRLPNSFMVNGSHRSITKHEISRSEVGLPEDCFVFCCFNNSYKITPQVFDIWMEILGRTDGSVLWLVEGNEAAAHRLREAARNRGIEPNRIVLARRMDLPTYLACYKLANLFLDTFYYSAGTTGSDALWAGLPLLTYLGQTFTGRVAASLLNAIGLPELIAKSHDEYKSIAVDLATNPQRLSAIKARLLHNKSTYPLFDTRLFTQHLEAAFIQIIEMNRKRIAQG